MKSLPKLLFVLASLFLFLLFTAPIWRITLEAPQYPGGVTLYIWINKLSGDSPGTLQNINILNHYIGMKYIEPDSIPELTYFPYIIIAMAVLGVALGLFAGHRFWIAWLVLLALLGALGIYDFYLWEYDYGHNLAPDAPIKIPGMAYQPPLIGSKMLLNFNAISYPHTGFAFVLICFILGVAAVVIKMKQLKPS
jgi:copper chaperone NosL